MVFLALLGNVFLYSQTIVHGSVRSADGVALRGDIQVVSLTARGTHANTVFTDADGNFSAEIPRARRVVLVAKSDGYASAESDIDPARPGEAHFVLRKASQVRGKVVRADGSVVPNANVYLRYPGEPRSFRFTDEAGPFITDLTGDFELPLVANDTDFVIDAFSDEFAPSSTAAIRTNGSVVNELTIVLRRRGQTIRVLTRRHGEPAAGVRIRLAATGDSGDFSDEERRSMAFVQRTQTMGVSGPDGVAVFRGVPPGRFRLGVPGYPPIERTATGDTELEVVLELP